MLVSYGEGERLRKLISVAVWSDGNESAEAEPLIGCLPTNLSFGCQHGCTPLQTQG